MAATLMPFRGPEQELFAHLRSSESYQSPRTSPTPLQNIPRSENCEQCLTPEVQNFLAHNKINTMPRRRSKEHSDFGSRSPSPFDHRYTEKPTWTEEDVKRIAASQESMVWGPRY